MPFIIENGILEDYIPENDETIVRLPASVTSIGDGAFQGCSALKEATIPSLAANIGKNVFAGCSSLKNNINS